MSMKVERFTRKNAISAIKHGFHSGRLLNSPRSQCVSNVKLSDEEFVSNLLDRRWALPHPDAKIHQVMLSTSKVPKPGRPFSDVSFFSNTNPSFGHVLIPESLALLGKERSLKFVVDAGTGTTAVGLGLGATCLGLPWEVTAVMLANTIDGYRHQEKRLISDFKRHFGVQIDHGFDEVDRGIVHWVERGHPRKFGNVLEGEVEACQHIAQKTGILVDPVYTLAAWEMAKQEAEEAATVVMLHTGGTPGMFGLAQRDCESIVKISSMSKLVSGKSRGGVTPTSVQSCRYPYNGGRGRAICLLYPKVTFSLKLDRKDTSRLF